MSSEAEAPSRPAKGPNYHMMVRVPPAPAVVPAVVLAVVRAVVRAVVVLRRGRRGR